MSDYDRWTQSVRASRQLYRLTVAPELWRCHELVVHADRVTRGLPTQWGDLSWRRGGMTASIGVLSARMAAAWWKLSRRAARAALVR